MAKMRVVHTMAYTTQQSTLWPGLHRDIYLRIGRFKVRQVYIQLILKTAVYPSHARTVVRECCKGDDESQWERVKFDPPPPKNPLTDGHQNLHT